MSLRYHTTGANNWASRPSDHRKSDANRSYWHGRVKPMEEPGLIARLLGARR